MIIGKMVRHGPVKENESRHAAFEQGQMRTPVNGPLFTLVPPPHTYQNVPGTPRFFRNSTTGRSFTSPFTLYPTPPHTYKL